MITLSQFKKLTYKSCLALYNGWHSLKLSSSWKMNENILQYESLKIFCKKQTIYLDIKLWSYLLFDIIIKFLQVHVWANLYTICEKFFIHSLGNFFNNLDMWIKGDVEKPLLKTKTGLVLMWFWYAVKSVAFFLLLIYVIFFYFKSNNSKFTPAISVQYTCTLTFRYI